MLPAHRVELTVPADGKLTLDHLPFPAGQAVEVIVLPRAAATTAPSPLQGTVVAYDRPTEPTAEGDWDAVQ